MNTILQKLVTGNGEIRTEFLNFMRPEFSPYYTKATIENKRCGATTNIAIIVNPPNLTPIAPQCGYFTYLIPPGLFTDIFTKQTKAMSLSLVNLDGTAITSGSWIRFNATGHFIYGFNVLSKSAAVSYYTLQAVHYKSGYKASAKTTVSVNNYAELTAISSSLCWIQFNLTVKYNTAFDDVTLLNIFIEKLVEYLNSSNNEVLIYEYARYSGYPFYLTVTWSNCTLTSLFQNNNFADSYYSSFNSLLKKFMDSSNGIYTNSNINIRRFFQDNSLFTLNAIYVNSYCSKPSNTPPKPSKKLVQITASCGQFLYHIPDNTFIDEQDGDTRQLSLILKTTENTELETNWLILNGQTINGIVSNDVIQGAKNGTYQFLLEAKDKNGLTGVVTVIITVPKDLLKDPIVTLKIFGETIIIFPSELILKLFLLKKMQKYVQESHPQMKLYFKTFRFIGSKFEVHLGECARCLGDYNAKMMLLTSDETVAIIKSMFSLELRISFVKSTTNYEVCAVIYSPTRDVTETIPYCEFKPIEIIDSKWLQYFSLEFTDLNGNKLPGNGWLWFINATLQAFPTEEFWKDHTKIKDTFKYQYIRDGVKFGDSTAVIVNLTKGTFLTFLICYDLATRHSF